MGGETHGSSAASPQALVAATAEKLASAVRDLASGEPRYGRTVAAALPAQGDFAGMLGDLLAAKLQDRWLPEPLLREAAGETFGDVAVAAAAAADLRACHERNPACPSILSAFLHFKGFQALQAYRVAHALWQRGEAHLATAVQARASEVYGVDIHPGARIGCGILLDHATGVVIGETAVVEDDVCLWHGVSLGSTFNEAGDRHPKIRRGVVIGAGALVLGNIEVAAGAVVAAGSVVLAPVPPGVTVAGIPARIVRNHTRASLIARRSGEE